MKKFLLAAVAAASLAVSATAANALTPLNQSDLDNFGTSHFGNTLMAPGIFTDVFNFTTVGPKNVNGSITTIRLGGTKDIDFSSIDIDGFAFTPNLGLNHEPNDDWTLTTTLIGNGSHVLSVHGNVVAAVEGAAASYGGDLNIGAVPEPATWALMIGGFGAAGAMLRRRRTLAFA